MSIRRNTNTKRDITIWEHISKTCPQAALNLLEFELVVLLFFLQSIINLHNWICLLFFWHFKYIIKFRIFIDSIIFTYYQTMLSRYCCHYIYHTTMEHNLKKGNRYFQLYEIQNHTNDDLIQGTYYWSKTEKRTIPDQIHIDVTVVWLAHAATSIYNNVLVWSSWHNVWHLQYKHTKCHSVSVRPKDVSVI